jgi:uncharacterized membrane protein
MFMVPTLILGAMLLLLVTTTAPVKATVRTSRVGEAIEIVRDRFARGEIDAAEYNRLVAGLTSPE